MSLPAPKLDHGPPESYKGDQNIRPIVKDDGFRDLVASIIEHGILQPPGVLESKRIIYGNRRIAAAIEAGLKSIPVMVYPATLGEGDILALTLIENLQRQDQTDYQTFTGLNRLKQACPDMLGKAIAKLIGKSEGMVSQYLRLNDLCPEAMESFKADKIGVTKAYKVATSPDPLATLALFLGGGTREEVGRKTRRVSAAPAVRASKIKVPLVSGATVTVAGEGVSLEEAIEAMGEAMKLAKAALSRGLNAKTAMNVWKDVAAAG